jgi:hypothetical protein
VSESLSYMVPAIHCLHCVLLFFYVVSVVEGVV